MERAEKFLLFARVFAERTTVLRHFALIHPAFGLFNLLITTTGENPNQRILDQMKRGFEEVNDNLRRLENELKMEIERNRVFKAMSDIETGYNAVQQMETSTNEVAWKLDLKATHAPTIEKDVNVVLDALSIFEALYNQSNGDRKKIVDLGAAISVNITMGFVVYETCEDLKPEGERRPVDERRQGIFSKFQTLIDTIKRYTDMCEENVSSNMEADIDRLLRENKKKDSSTTCENLGKFLELKYDWLWISAIVYSVFKRDCCGGVWAEHSIARRPYDNSSERGRFLKLEFEEKNTCVRYYKKSGGTYSGYRKTEAILSRIEVRTQSCDMLNAKFK